jgi:hypothetical protein
MERRGFFKALAAGVVAAVVGKSFKGRPLRTQPDRDLMEPPYPREFETAHPEIVFTSSHGKTYFVSCDFTTSGSEHGITSWTSM